LRRKPHPAIRRHLRAPDRMQRLANLGPDGNSRLDWVFNKEDGEPHRRGSASPFGQLAIGHGANPDGGSHVSSGRPHLQQRRQA
jgi:hypothetical protein